MVAPLDYLHVDRVYDTRGEQLLEILLRIDKFSDGRQLNSKSPQHRNRTVVPE